ncbi:MAG TPA: DEAD/DEAH box helicase [Verrucomicrobiae bacterium]|nr:DEAD/DEAH box helicase [Verrucomicrobiae bacterium]
MLQQSSAGSVAPAPDVSRVDVTFHDLGIAPQILRSLDHYKLINPTPIQRDAIPLVAIGNDVTGIAQTGTGKTMAFGIPLAQRLMLQGGNALIMVPTRELAFQVAENLSRITRALNLKMGIFVGGELMYRQLRMLKLGQPDIFVCTPGRLNDIIRRKKIDLSKVNVVVLDEADRMLDMGFAPQIESVMEQVPEDRQTLLFSATMPASIVKLAQKYQKDPVRVEVAPAGSTADMVSQELVVVPSGQKIDILESVLREYKMGPILIFTRTKGGASTLAKHINTVGHRAEEIHSERTLQERRQALADFKNGRVRILVATDIAARGIDVKDISLVLNYDLPENAEDYVHRIGRTGRAGKGGHAISFATPDQGKEVKAIERLIRISIPRSDRTDTVMSDVFRSGGDRGGRSRGGRDRFGGRGDRSRNEEPEISFTNISAPSGFTGPRSVRKRR